MTALLLLWAALAHAQTALPTCRDLDAAHADASHHRHHERVGLFRNTAWLALRVWQLGVSPADGATCTKWPSCSAYAVRAVRDRSPLAAPFLATARILSNHNDHDLPRCLAGGRVYLYDPVSDSVFWRRRDRQRSAR